MTLVLYYVLFHLQFYGFPSFQHKQNTSTRTLNSHDYDHLFHKWEGIIGEELEDRKEEGVVKVMPQYKKKEPEIELGNLWSKLKGE